jgi:hypothetical protein
MSNPIDPYADNPQATVFPAQIATDKMVEIQSAQRKASTGQQTATEQAPKGQPDAQLTEGGSDNAAAAPATPSFELPEGFDVKNLPDHMDPETAYNMARYWQSELAKAKKAGDPDEIARRSAEIVLEQQRKSQPEQKPEVQTLEKPVAPVAPTIPEDPYGDEWDDYVKKAHQYNVAMAEHQTKYQEYIDAKLEKEINSFRQQQNAPDESAVIEQAAAEASARYGMNIADARGFVQQIASGEIFNDVEVLSKAYLMSRNTSTEGADDSALENLRQSVVERNGKAEQQRLPTTPSGHSVANGKPQSGLFTVSEGTIDPFK